MRRIIPLAAAIGALALPAPVGASGITTHAFMAEAAIPLVEDPQLRTLLDAHRDEVRSGAHYPDGGYGSSSYPGGDYGEISHWERFTNAYAAHLRAREDCGDLTRVDGPCADEVAHLMGTAGHGVGDEMWDWLFEPRMADYGESPVHPVFRAGLPGSAELSRLPPGSYANTPEFTMDNIALVEHDRLTKPPLYPPPFDDLLAVYRALGRTDITRDGIAAGHTIITAAAAGERAAVGAEYPRVKTTMPRSSAEYYEGAGGVLDVAEAAAGYYEALWHKLTRGDHPTPRVVSTYPEPGQHGTATRFEGVSSSPGPLGGGARSRIIAVLSNSLDSSTVTPESFELVDEDRLRVPLATDWPRAGPYGDGYGTHSMMLWPANDLRVCHTYTAVVTRSLRDHAGAKLERPYRWSFTTEGENGAACPATEESTGPQQPAAAHRAHGHAHTSPDRSLVALRRARAVGAAVEVTLSCLGPSSCSGRLALTVRAGARVARTASVRFAVAHLRTQVVAVRLDRTAARLGRRRDAVAEVRAGGATTAATTRRLAMR